MNKTAKIFVIDDERILRVTVADYLRDEGYVVQEFASARAVLAEIGRCDVNVVITDLKMPEMDGMEFLKKVKTIKPDISVIMMTAYGTLENAVEAMKAGAYDYITKPFGKEELLLRLERIVEMQTVKASNKRLQQQIEEKFDFSSYIGDSRMKREIFDLVKIVAPTDSTVLIVGETGTGKELLTNIIHYNSLRNKKGLVKVSCAVLSREIFESELFGHVKGAFTGADHDKQGRFELADGGTIYLDDIDDVPLDLQVKLLRVMEQREIERVGSAKTISIDVRVVASTKKDLRKLVAENKFREDLFYRLNVFPINIPPLRERKNDIKYMADYFITRFADNRQVRITDEAFQYLLDYNWPGNVRELKNISERMVLMATDGIIEAFKIPAEIRQPGVPGLNYLSAGKPLEQCLGEIEIAYIKSALVQSKNNKSKAAELLGLPPSTLRTKMNKYGMG